MISFTCLIEHFGVVTEKDAVKQRCQCKAYAAADDLVVLDANARYNWYRTVGNFNYSLLSSTITINCGNTMAIGVGWSVRNNNNSSSPSPFIITHQPPRLN